MTKLRPSEAAAAFIKDQERLRLRAYKPTTNDVWTIGWGATGSEVKEGMIWTRSEAEAHFSQTLEDVAAGVRRLLKGVETTQGQFDALVSFAYNVGLDENRNGKAEGLGESTLLRKHLAGDHDGAALEFARWNRQKGKVLKGLTTRRAAEAAMYRSRRP